MTQTPPVTVCALYHFARLENFESLKAPMLDLMERREIRGTLLLAREGINGTVAGKQTDIDALLAHLTAIEGLEGLTWKFSFDDEMPFYKPGQTQKRDRHDGGTGHRP